MAVRALTQWPNKAQRCLRRSLCAAAIFRPTDTTAGTGVGQHMWPFAVPNIPSPSLAAVAAADPAAPTRSPRARRPTTPSDTSLAPPACCSGSPGSSARPPVHPLRGHPRGPLARDSCDWCCGVSPQDSRWRTACSPQADIRLWSTRRISAVHQQADHLAKGPPPPGGLPVRPKSQPHHLNTERAIAP